VVPNLAGVVLEGKYRLTVPLGEGGMGFVYAGEHTTLRRPLAVKFLRPELASDPNALARLHQEAVAASGIGSPHIVEVLDLGTAPGGAPYIVMEFLRGRPLAMLMAEQPILPVPRIANILCQTLLALGAAHARGIVHRDLKPENIFLVDMSGSDFVKLLDFGVSKVRGDLSTSNLTQTGAVLGTPRYMAPEQAAGRKDIDHRVDLWAAGVILYRAVTGRFPYDAENYNALLAAILMANPLPPRQVRPDLDPRIESIILSALTRDPGARFGSAEQFRKALAPFAAVSSVSSAAYSMPATPRGWPAATPPGHAAPLTASPSVQTAPYVQPAALPPGPPAGGPALPAAPSVSMSWSAGGTSVPAVGAQATVVGATKIGHRGLWIGLAVLGAGVVGSTAAWLIIAPPWNSGLSTTPTPPTIAAADAEVVAARTTPFGWGNAAPPTTAGLPAPPPPVVREGDAPGVPAVPSATPDAAEEEEEEEAGGFDPAIMRMVLQMSGGDGGPGTGLEPPDVTGEAAAERELYAAIALDMTCEMAHASMAYAAAQMSPRGGPDPMAYSAAMAELERTVAARHGLSLEQYGELAERWSSDIELAMRITRTAMQCYFPQAGAGGVRE